MFYVNCEMFKQRTASDWSEVEISVVYTWEIFLRIKWQKIFENRSTLAKVIIEYQVA